MNRSFHLHRSVWIRFLCVFLPLTGIIALASWGIYYLQYVKTHQDILRAQEIYSQHLKEEYVKLRISTIISDLHVIAYHRQPIDLIEGLRDEAHFTQELLSFSKYKGIYDQVRILDDEGAEVVRIDLRGENPVLVPSVELQFKGKRYYFKDIYGLDQGQVYMSRLDLNIEQGEIERPLKPMIRFGMPLFDQNGEKQGVLILNYLGDELLSALEELSFESPGQYMLLSRNGYWLKGLRPEEEWGFMIDSRADQTMPNRYPDLWKRILENSKGQFVSDRGLITFCRIYPLRPGVVSIPQEVVSSDGATSPEASSLNYLNPDEFFWILVSVVPPEKMHSAGGGFVYALIGSDILLLLLLGGVSWRLIVSNEKRRQAERSLRNWNSELEKRIQERTRELTDSNEALHRKIEEYDRSVAEKKTDGVSASAGAEDGGHRDTGRWYCTRLQQHSDADQRLCGNGSDAAERRRSAAE